ncbi:hypothetical protein H7F51_09490 [Novosphingobium flavum]|uniref:Restriction endonuclease n=1 Tax=Novosphingobium flavum TaxID=1778672 RepID=A0A7X1KLM4_9SPHN|nr:hypothetical protein [Novosphingobium flavum]MBC2665756.1 hypothetical protein [Novosphingobium flavum]
MSASSDLHIETMNLASDWTRLVGNILNQRQIGQAAAQKPDEAPSDEEEWAMFQYAPDLAFTPIGATDATAVEIKMLRWRKNWLGRVGGAVAHMEQILAHGSFPRGIILFTAAISPEWLAELNDGSSDLVEVWDLAKLREMASLDPELSDALEELAAETMLDGPAPERMPRREAAPGATIAARLRDTEPGTAGWRAFEVGCYDAIRLLFGRELQNLITQQKSDDGLSKMDLIGRIRSEPNTFWSIIAGDFVSRYVVFDAKNYVEPIGQAQIHSTAKYLMRNGLRKVAILLTRQGASESARQASAGYLRHDGFLMLTLNLADLCLMLEDFDTGTTPENLLFERMDEALMALNR